MDVVAAAVPDLSGTAVFLFKILGVIILSDKFRILIKYIIIISGKRILHRADLPIQGGNV